MNHNIFKIILVMFIILFGLLLGYKSYTIVNEITEKENKELQIILK